MLTEIQNSKPDTGLVNLLVALSDAYVSIDPANALKKGESALKLANELNWRKGIASSQRIIGKTYVFGLGNTQKGMEFLIPALEESKRLKWQKGEGLALSNIGTAWYYNNQVDSALHYWTGARKIFKEIKDVKEEVKVILNLGNAWGEKGETERAIEYFNETVRIQSAEGNKDGESKAHYNLGILLAAQGNLVESLDEHFKSLTLSEQTGNKNGIAGSYRQIADSYRLNGETEKALHFAKLATKAARELGNKLMEEGALITLGMIYYEQEKYSEAMSAYDSAQSIGKISGNKRLLAFRYRNIGNLYAKRGEAVPALENYLKALGLSSEMDGSGYIVDLERVGQQYLAISMMKDEKLPDSLQNKKLLLEKSKHFLEEAVIESKKFGNTILLKNLHEALSKLYKEEGDWKNAYEQYILFKQLQDSIFSTDNKVTIARLEAKREVELKQKEIEIQKLELKAGRNQRWFIMAGGLLILIVAGLLFNRYRSMQRIKRLNEMEKIRSRISRDLHDDIGSTLSSINLITHSAKKRLGEKDLVKTHEQLETIEDRTKKMLGNMRDIVWNIKPQNDRIDIFLQRMEEYLLSMIEAKGITSRLDFSSVDPDLHLPLDLKHNLYLIFKEAVNNLVRHSNCTMVEVSLCVLGNKLQMEIKDNGTGFLPENIKGNGLLNMERRAREVNAKLTIETSPKSGTKIVFSVILPRTWDKVSSANH